MRENDILVRSVLYKLAENNAQRELYERLCDNLLSYSFGNPTDRDINKTVIDMHKPYLRAFAENHISMLLSRADEIYVSIIIDIIKELIAKHDDIKNELLEVKK